MIQSSSCIFLLNLIVVICFGPTNRAMGGNFWEGFRIGAITAGLNHLGNHTKQTIRRNILRNQLSKIFKNPETPAAKIPGMIEILLEIPIIRKEYAKVIGRWQYEIAYENNSTGDLGITGGREGNRAFSTFYDNAFDSTYQLAVTVHHELIHACHHVYRTYNNWVNKLNVEAQGIYYAHWMSEYYAYEQSWLATGDIYYYHEMNNA